MATAELNYKTHDKELLAIFWSFGRWRHYLLLVQSQFTVLTDHNNLEYFMVSKVLTRRQVHWAEMLAEFNFIIKYCPGVQGGKLDTFSHLDNIYPQTGGGGSICCKQSEEHSSRSATELTRHCFNKFYSNRGGQVS